MATVDGMIFLAIPTIPSGSYFLQVEAGQLHGNGQIIVVNKK
jgi:hypothetical protein